MSLDLSIRLYPTTTSYSPGEIFPRLVEAVGSWDHTVTGEWSDFKIRPPNPLAKRPERKQERVAGPLPTTELVRLAAAAAATARPGLRLSAQVPFRCWRHAGRVGEAEYCRLSVDCWSPNSALRGFHGHPAVEGHAEVWVNPVPALWPLRDKSGNFCSTEADDRVGENLDALLSLLLGLARTERPPSLKLFVDRGDYLPFNAHCAYFADERAVIADFDLLSEAWEAGLPAYHIPPLRVYDPRRHTWALDERRWNALNEVMGKAELVTPDVVAAALRQTTLDVQRTDGGGFLLLDYPYFMDSFVDRFFVEVLRLA